VTENNQPSLNRSNITCQVFLVVRWLIVTRDFENAKKAVELRGDSIQC
jgi:hypothetical protein